MCCRHHKAAASEQSLLLSVSSFAADIDLLGRGIIRVLFLLKWVHKVRFRASKT